MGAAKQFRPVSEDTRHTIEEAALFLRVSIKTVRRWILSRGLKSIKIGRQRLFRKSDLEAFERKENLRHQKVG